MTPSHSTRGAAKRYRYYVCTAAQKRGWQSCPSKSIPAGQIEEFVVEQIKCIGRDPALVRAVLEQARQQGTEQVAGLEAEQRGLAKDLVSWHGEIRRLSSQLRPGEDNGPVVARLADLQERIGRVEARAQQIREQVRAAQRQLVDEEQAAMALSVFDPVWGELAPREQARAVGLLVRQVDYDGAQG